MNRTRRITAGVMTLTIAASLFIAPIAAQASEEGRRNTAIAIGAVALGLLLTQHNGGHDRDDYRDRWDRRDNFGYNRWGQEGYDRDDRRNDRDRDRDDHNWNSSNDRNDRYDHNQRNDNHNGHSGGYRNWRGR